MSQHSHAKQRNWFARHKLLTAAGALVVVVGIGAGMSGGGDGDDGKTSAAGSTEKKEKKGTGQEDGGGKEKAAKGALKGNGTYQVGSDVEPGTYRSLGNKLGCYWERAKDSSGDPDAILANDNVIGASYVTVKAEDKIFKTQGCKSWERVAEGQASGSPKTEMPGNGMYKVGADIAPGTYKSAGNKKDGCYWERAKDALHESADSILANENVTGNAIVTIAPGDAYFKTNGCSDWKKTG
ncbi:hypothetical protein B7P34_29795 [Streptosporangium nondiastaticum]|uniref:Uncharacterized protein n=1 Tax=Streptosporangium nondiastaticum TaxID=35764 RepID=A0A9X7PEN2_9ACTN|nr:hypothetical protein [Streptosporangium nondiastaticum]PSJ25118.1 hypothetical protein B7P34_29795 [Streptosporangium nondiastaticum]